MKYFMIEPLDNGKFELYCFKFEDVVFSDVFESEEAATAAGKKYLDGELTIA